MPYQYGMGLPPGIQLASPGKRIMARIIDWLIMLVVIVPIFVVIFALAGSTNTTNGGFESNLGFGGTILLSLAVEAVVVAYEISFTALKGATPGKMLMKVKVVREADGQLPGWGTATMRWLPQLVSVVCSLLSLALWIWAFVNLFANERRQTPFDLAAHTLVIDVG